MAILVGVLLSGLSLLGVVTWRERPRGPLQTVELRFGADVSTDTVEAMLASVAGLRSNAAVLIDAVADHEGIRHFLHAPAQTLDTLRSQWRGALPSLRMDACGDAPAADWHSGAVVRLSGSRPVLRSDAVAHSTAALLGSLTPLGDRERLLVRWCLGAGVHPVLPQSLSRREAHGAGTGLAHLLLAEPTPQSADVRALRLKYAGPVVGASAIVAVQAEHPKRAAHLLSRVISTMRSRGGAYGHLTVQRRGRRRLLGLLSRRTLGRRDLYAPAELAGLLPVPIDAPQVPGLRLGTAPLLMPSPRIPATGRVVAISNWPGSERPLAQTVIGGMSHTLICGPTGVGKSSLICSLAVQTALAGQGFLALDGKGGELADDILARLPERRHGDVIVVDPVAGARVPGLRVFGYGTDVETTAELVLGVFESLFASTWGPMSAKWIRAALIAVAHDPQGTLAHVPLVFSDRAYRRWLVGRIDDPLLKGTFAAYEEMRPAERVHQLAAALNKVEEIVGRRVVRGVLAQPNPTIDMREVLATGKIVIVSLAPARIGPAARLIAALFIYRLFEAVMARSAAPASARQPFFAYIDEPKVLADIPVPLDGLFEMARSANVGVVLASQSLSQLPQQLRLAATTNAASWVVFRQSSTDAKLLAPELPNISSEALQNLNQYEVVTQIALGPGDVAPPASGRTLPPSAPVSDPVVLRRLSAERYGTDPAEVDAALTDRRGASPDGPSVGLARRDS